MSFGHINTNHYSPAALRFCARFALLLVAAAFCSVGLISDYVAAQYPSIYPAYPAANGATTSRATDNQMVGTPVSESRTQPQPYTRPYDNRVGRTLPKPPPTRVPYDPRRFDRSLSLRSRTEPRFAPVATPSNLAPNGSSGGISQYDASRNGMSGRDASQSALGQNDTRTQFAQSDTYPRYGGSPSAAGMAAEATGADGSRYNGTNPAQDPRAGMASPLQNGQMQPGSMQGQALNSTPNRTQGQISNQPTSPSPRVATRPPQVARNSSPQKPNPNLILNGTVDLTPRMNANGQPIEHPLMPILRWAENERPRVAQIQDYTGVMHKKERIKGEIVDEKMAFKLRQEPYSIYLYFVEPENIRGQEALYVEGANDGKMKGHGVGIRGMVGTLNLDPEGDMARAGSKYTIKEMGILKLIDKFIEIGEHDSKCGECHVSFAPDMKLPDGRSCSCIQVIHPVERTDFTFHKALIYIDNELRLPLCYMSFGWPDRPGEDPPLTEYFYYSNLQFSTGLTGSDFDHRNPSYNF